MRNPVQSTVIKKVLLDREVEIEGRLLENHPDQLQAIEGPFADVHAKDADRALGLGVELTPGLHLSRPAACPV